MDYWKILNLKEGASAEEIKKSYRLLAKKYHPDHNSSPDAEIKFREVQEAYDYLLAHPDYKSPDSASSSDNFHENSYKTNDSSSGTKTYSYTETSWSFTGDYTSANDDTFRDSGTNNEKTESEKQNSAGQRNFHKRYTRSYSAAGNSFGTNSYHHSYGQKNNSAFSENASHSNSNSYHKSSFSDSAKDYYNSFGHTWSTGSSYTQTQNSSYENNRNDYGNYSQPYYKKPEQSYMRQHGEKSVWEKIGIALLIIAGIIIAAPIFFYIIIFMAVFGL